MADETPLFLQYLSIKKQHPNEVLFFRLGDFYEMFNEDAIEVSRLLNLTLTHKGDNPMCGIPYHASKIYIARLLRMGKKIAIAEQVGEIAKKGLTERKVVEVITPGTAVESEYLDGGNASFLACLYVKNKNAGLAFIDVTTGEFKATSFSEEQLAENLPKELGRIAPRELLLSESLKNNEVIQYCIETLGISTVSYYPDWQFNAEKAYEHLKNQFQTANLNAFSLDERSPVIVPAGFLLDYLEFTTNTVSPHVRGIELYSDEHFVMIDDSSRRNLEIISNVRDGSSQYTLFECVNYCKTSMGGRLIRQWLSFPLTNRELILRRQSHVEYFVNNRSLHHKVSEFLSGILDVERLAARIAMDRAHAKDLQALRYSLEKWLCTREVLAETEFSVLESETAKKIIDLIAGAIVEDPATVFTEGRIIREGWSEELDHWRGVQQNFQSILDEYLNEEKSKTGIQNLRIKNTGNQGYYIEVTKGNISKVPEHFVMKRAMLNCDRYTTEKLQELEQSLNDSDSKILALEHDLFIEIRNELKNHVPYLQKTSREIAYVDTISSFAEAAVVHTWVRPEIMEDNTYYVKNGRHPVVENHLPTGEFVPNDLFLSCAGEKDFETFALITGPNMAGKSTFLRQNALISLLAQTGSFVPCDEARLSVVDRIFCRVGASDNLAKGESTFLVEMTETARILRSATEKSLVIMDEVGRGTSTEDGLSIAWAVSEYLLEKLKCKTLFATHYHELTRLEHNSMKRLCMAVSEEGQKIVFLRKVISGASENSYGIHVARLAGVPETVIKRAQDILNRIQSDAGEKSIPEVSKPEFTDEKEDAKVTKYASLTGCLFSDEEMVLDEILSIDTDNLTPIQALQILERMKKTLMAQ